MATRTPEQDYMQAFGVAEYARWRREEGERQRAFALKTDALLAPRGFRLAKDESGARYEWLRIDDRKVDDGLCKVWVVPI